MNADTFNNELEYYYRLCGPCVGSPASKIFTASHKEILLCNWKLGVSMYHIQEFMRDHIYEYTNGKRTILPSIITFRFP